MQEPQTASALQQTLNEREESQYARFGTFQGVFCPTLLTILGVIMFLRTGWVVGHAGLLGAWSIILLASAITLCTALSISTVTTNIRIGSGGAFSIISQSLGLEVGGSVGVPLYLCQALAVAMYIFGFREGWHSLFPDHPALLIDLGTFACLFLIGLISADVAFRIQYVLLAVLGASLVSVFGALASAPTHAPVWVGEFQGDNDYWLLFAVFFPAVTGILAGLNMSGELREPRSSIPKGTLWAISVSTVLYMALAWWCSVVATPEELLTNYKIVLDKALWPPVVTAGLLGATFSSGLSSLVGAPRILQALGEHNVLPGSQWFAQRTGKGEPRNAVLLTGVIVLAALLLRELNVIAPLLTLFFLITYGMLNFVTLLEQKLALSSFRPLLKIHPAIPFLGAVGCVFAMAIVHPVASIVAVVSVAALYGVLLTRNLESPSGDVRSGLLTSLAEWLAKKVARLPGAERAWRPILLLPITEASELRSEFRFLRALAYPQGTLKLVGVAEPDTQEALEKELPELAQAFREQGVYTTSTVLDGDGYSERVLTAIQALGGAFFRPNVLFLSVPEATEADEETERLITRARACGLGVLLFAEDQKNRLGMEKTINVWVRDQAPHWSLSMDLGNKDASLLTAHLLNTVWEGQVRVLCGIAEEDMRDVATVYLERLLQLARMPDVEVVVLTGSFQQLLEKAPSADLNIFGMPEPVDLDFVRKTFQMAGSTCIFTRDSGRENVLA